MLVPRLVWFRRDLRDVDNAALAAALASGAPVFCTFVFDTAILDALPLRADRRLAFIHGALLELDAALRERGGGLIVRHGDARDEIPRLAAELGVAVVHAGRDYEPFARVRDAAVAEALSADGRSLELVREHVLLDGDEVLTQAGRPYTVFTPYKNAWLRRLHELGVSVHASGEGVLAKPPVASGVPSLADIGFDAVDLAGIGVRPGMSGAAERLADFRGRMPRYREQRDFPAVKGVSYLSPHLRFGTVSIRQLLREALQAGGEGGMTWLSELAWRDFYFMILDRFPHVASSSFRPEYDAIIWDAWPQGLAAWRAGQTGFPLVDAAMRQLSATGWMHNRLRMVVAMFLTKNLLIDWRVGERWFMRHLIDGDLASNSHGWQWVAGTGTDAAPYFRIFNPTAQAHRFDPDGDYVRRWVLELAAVGGGAVHEPGLLRPAGYPPPMVDHAAEREDALARYRQVAAGSR